MNENHSFSQMYANNSDIRELAHLNLVKIQETLFIFWGNFADCFSNREPNRRELSMDRWIILKISEDLMVLTEITDDRTGVNKKKKMVNESEDSWDGGEQTDDDWWEIKADQKWV